MAFFNWLVMLSTYKYQANHSQWMSTWLALFCLKNLMSSNLLLRYIAAVAVPWSYSMCLDVQVAAFVWPDISGV